MHSIRSALDLGLAVVFVLDCPVAQAVAEPSAAAVKAVVRKAARDHLAHPSGVDVCHWVIAPFYDGLVRTGLVADDPELIAAMLDFGQQAGWMPGYRFYHADDVAVGHAWLDLYQLDPTKKERLDPVQQRLDRILAHPVTEELDDFTAKPRTPGVEVTDRWTWCDALYMAPPTLARLFALTGDQKYLEFLDREYRFAHDRLYDPEAKLFYRDSRFVGPAGKRSPNGKKVFWGRGNGWVYGGLALLLEQLPAGHPSRRFYERLFREMSTAVLGTQQADGFWYPNLADAKEIARGESSGTGLFVFGLAWGVNSGLLDRGEHWPAVLRGWQALVSSLRPDGRVGLVQQIGFQPDQFGPDSIQDYGTGAFLLAGAELLRGLGGAAARAPDEIYAEAVKLRDARPVVPRAYARLVPERKDDIAWENDKVAFRVYGPALRAGAEGSGIDAWTKRVPHPVIDTWYRLARTQGITYHEDHGEGLDAYHVGGSRGCGGIGLWIDGKLVTADTYVGYQVHWTKPDVAVFSTIYQYPSQGKGRPVFEHRVTRLHLGARMADIEIHFAHSKSRAAQPIAFEPEIAIGLVTQGAGAKVILEAGPRAMAVYEPFAGGSLGTGVIVAGDQPVRRAELAAEDPKGLHGHALLITRLGGDKRLRYRTGFAWSKDGEITSEEAWLDYLRKAEPR